MKEYNNVRGRTLVAGVPRCAGDQVSRTGRDGEANSWFLAQIME